MGQIIWKCILQIRNTSPLVHIGAFIAGVEDKAEAGMAATLPCFWIYREVGDYIYKNHSKNNPYQQWIDTYAGEEFGLSVAQAIDICDAAASRCTGKQQQAMTDAFVTASLLEFQFWDSAYSLKKW